MNKPENPEVLAVVALPSAAERRRREILLTRVMLVAIDLVLSGEGMGLETARDLGKEIRHTYPELVEECSNLRQSGGRRSRNRGPAGRGTQYVASTYLNSLLY